MITVTRTLQADVPDALRTICKAMGYVRADIWRQRFRGGSMSAPDRIYIHTGDCDDTYYELSDCCDDEVDYIRTDIHEAEITALKAEIAALKAPPKGLSAEEVTEPGFYLVRADNINPWVPCIVVRINEEIDELRMLLLGRSEEFSVVGELRPFQMPEVCDAG